MTCVSDSLYLYQAVFIYDVVAFFAIGAESKPVWTSMYYNANLSMIGYTIISVLSPDRALAEAGISGGVAAGVLVTMLVLTKVAAQWAGVFTAALLMCVLGSAIQFGEHYASDFFGEATATDLAPKTKMLILVVCIGLLVFAVTIIHAVLEKARIFIYCIIFASIGELVTRIMYFQGMFRSEWCCNKAEPRACPLYFDIYDATFILAAFLWRLFAVLTQAYYKRSIERLQDNKKALDELVKNARDLKEVKPDGGATAKSKTAGCCRRRK
jgi:hypothetical protein